MGGAAAAPVRAVQAAVSTVTSAVKDVAKQPIKGISEVATLGAREPLAAIGSAAGATSGIPLVGTLTQGAQAGADALKNLADFKLPTGAQVKDLAEAGAIIGGGVDLGGGGSPGFDFSSFLDSGGGGTRYYGGGGGGTGSPESLPVLYGSPSRGNILLPLMLSAVAAVALFYLRKG